MSSTLSATALRRLQQELWKSFIDFFVWAAARTKPCNAAAFHARHLAELSYGLGSYPTFEEQLGDGRMTLLVRPEHDALWQCDEWCRAGVGETSELFVGAPCFQKATLDTFDVEPEGQDFVAKKARGLRQPGEPILTERFEHELTHLPFKPWCEVCLRAKSRQAKSRKLSLRQPVLQMDFSFLSDKPGDDSVTILNVMRRACHLLWSFLRSHERLARRLS